MPDTTATAERLYLKGDVPFPSPIPYFEIEILELGDPETKYFFTL